MESENIIMLSTDRGMCITPNTSVFASNRPQHSTSFLLAVLESAVLHFLKDDFISRLSYFLKTKGIYTHTRRSSRFSASFLSCCIQFVCSAYKHVRSGCLNSTDSNHPVTKILHGCHTTKTAANELTATCHTSK